MTQTPGRHDRQPSLRPVSNERFIRFHQQWAQEVADRTGVNTDMYRAENGSPALTLEGWPLPGEFVKTFEAAPRRHTRPSAPATEGVPVAASAVRAAGV